jgi:methanogenic corrinoid protein MtbC1
VIRWCCYCQTFLGELAPYDDPSFSHGICERCEAQLERDVPLVETTDQVRTLVYGLLAAAESRDWDTCQVAIQEARELGLPDDSILVAVLQPALYRAGLEWQAGRMSVAAEHFLTSWCEQVFATLPRPVRTAPPSALLFQTPGNQHTLGVRFAAHLLAARGVSAEVVSPAIPLSEMIALARRLRPSAIGFSCALPHSARVASDLVSSLRAELEPELECRYLLGGFAFRLGADVAVEAPAAGIEIVQDLTLLTAGWHQPA